MLNSPIDEIKSRLDIVEVIGSYIKLKKAGANYRALCPFHSEKNPSFFVSPARQIWHCFGCQKGGDIFGFVKEIEGVEFGDALRILAQKAGVELKPFRPEFKEAQTQRHHFYEISEWAAKFFEVQLEGSKIGQEAKKYLLGRGISEDSIKKWRLGYAPDAWRGLNDFLVEKGYRKEEIEKAGLAIKGEQGNFYDRFRGRIMFPVFDLNSQAVGFGGRIFETDKKKEDERKAIEGKYVNIHNSLIYDKSRILYGLDKAKVEIRKQDSCILVEGYTDAIMAHQAGTQNAVAVSGTALTPWHLKILQRYTNNLLTCFDMDLAGDTATKRGIDLALTQGFNIKIITLPEGKDPADLILKSPELWGKAAQNAKSILDFYFDSTLEKFDKSKIEGKKEISKILLPIIKRISNKIEQTFWLQRLAKEIRAREEDLVWEMAKVKLEQEILGLEPEEIINLPQKSRKELLEERLITLILKRPENPEGKPSASYGAGLNLIEGYPLSYFSSKEKELISALKKNLKNPENLSGETKDFFNYLALKSEVEEIEEKEIVPEIQFCLKEIQSLGIKSKLNEISREIKKAEEDKNLEKVKKLTQEFFQLSKEI